MQSFITPARKSGVLMALLLIVACTDGPAPVAPPSAPSLASAPAGGTVPASVEWNAVARGLVAKNRANVFVAFRTYALVSVAQEQAFREARLTSKGQPEVSARAAMAAASVGVLARLFPAAVDVAAVEATLQQQVGSADWLEGHGVDAAAGVALGRAIAATVMQRAASDGYTDA